MRCLSEITPIQGNTISLTVGTFDGVHRGHQAVLGKLRASGETSVCITFSNHPSTTLQPESPSPLLCTTPHKSRLIEQSGVDILFLLPFTTTFASQSPRQFLTDLHAQIPFSTLILGHDARLGCDRAGTPQVIQSVADEIGFALDYLPPLLLDDQPISSSRIRNAIQSGALIEAERLLGRPVSFFSTVAPGAGKGRRIGYPTANLNIQGICMPPFGVYAITLLLDNHRYPGVANLGVAPTLQSERAPMLEAHLFEHAADLYGQDVEVVLHEFVRPERRFNSPDELRKQIGQDIAQAQAILTGTNHQTAGGAPD